MINNMYFLITREFEAFSGTESEEDADSSEEESESGDPRAGAALEPSQPAAGPEDPGLIHRTQGYTVLAANS